VAHAKIVSGWGGTLLLMLLTVANHPVPIVS
jgi:hypothetical protein